MCTALKAYLNIHIKKREYRNDTKGKETRLGWGEAHNVCKECMGITPLRDTHTSGGVGQAHRRVRAYEKVT